MNRSEILAATSIGSPASNKPTRTLPVAPQMSVREALLAAALERDVLSRYQQASSLGGSHGGLAVPSSLLDTPSLGAGSSTTEDYLRDILALPPILSNGFMSGPSVGPSSPFVSRRRASNTDLLGAAVERRRLEFERINTIRQQALALTEDNPLLPTTSDSIHNILQRNRIQQQQQQQHHHQALLQQHQKQQQLHQSSFLKQLSPEGTLEALGSSMRKKNSPYIDASDMAEPDPAELARSRRTRGGVTEPFPEKLQRMLKEVADSGDSDIISFYSHGRAFAVHDPERFTKEVMPKYFKQSRLSSFQRQLNLYGFARITSGPDTGGYYHELFLQGRPSLCVHMRRVGVPHGTEDRRKLKSSTKKKEPDFYAMKSASK